MRRWSIPVGLALFASPAAALADDALYKCAKVAPDAKLTIQFTPDVTLHDLGVWITGFTCKSVVYDTEAAARATKLALIAPSSVTPKQAVKLFVDTVQKTGLVVAEKAETFVITDPAPQRRCPRATAPRASTGPTPCARTTPDARYAINFKPDSSLDDLAAWATGLLCKRVIFDPSIATHATTATLIVSAQVTEKQAAQLFVDAVASTGLVVTEKGNTFEVKPGPRWSHCAAPPPAPPPTAPDPNAPDPSAPPTIDPAVTAALDAGIREIDDTHFEVKRTLLDKIDADPMLYMKGARVVPAMKNGKVDGFKLYAIRPGSLFLRLGLRNGDTVQTVNGQLLESADKALEIYTSVKRAKQVELGISRRGKPLTLTITIVK